MLIRGYIFATFFMMIHPFLFLSADFNTETEFVLKHSPLGGAKRAIVSGQSVVGMLAAAVLAKSGYQVDCFEIRKDYTRNIQWAIRQSLVNELASIDEKLAEDFLTEIARPIHKGSIHVYTDGYRRHKQHDGLGKGNPEAIPLNCADMMAHPSVGIVEAKKFEKFLKRYLLSLPNIRLQHESIHLEKMKNSYYAKGHRFPDLIVIAEGFNSASRSVANILSIPVAENKLQISGKIDLDSGGIMIKHWRKESGSIRLTGMMGRAGSDGTWIVADVDPSIVKRQDSIDKEFRRLTAEALGLPLEEIEDLKIAGITDEKPVSLFLLKQAICEVATRGDNLILIGDAVGAGHWSTGGGMQTAAVCHIERLKTLLQNLASGKEKVTTLSEYSLGVLSDTKTWIEVSLSEKPRISKEELNHVPLEKFGAVPYIVGINN